MVEFKSGNTSNPVPASDTGEGCYKNALNVCFWIDLNDLVNKELNLNLYRSRNRENIIRSGKVESCRIAVRFYSYPYEVSLYTNKCI